MQMKMCAQAPVCLADLQRTRGWQVCRARMEYAENTPNQSTEGEKVPPQPLHFES